MKNTRLVVVVGAVVLMACAGMVAAQSQSGRSSESILVGGKGGQPPPGPRCEERFASMDTDHNGIVSKAEFLAAPPPPPPPHGGRPGGGPGSGSGNHTSAVPGDRAKSGPSGFSQERPPGPPPKPEEIFKKIDRNGDGVLTKDELCSDRGRGRDGNK